MARRLSAAAIAAILAAAAAATAEVEPKARPDPERWVGTWASSAQRADDAQAAPAAGFPDTTLRQLVRVSIGGPRLRVRFSNAFGTTALTLLKASVALPAGGGAIRPASDRPLAFQGRASVTIPPGALVLSDRPFDGNAAYFTAEAEAHRQAVNAWIRTGGRFDGVIDFDAAVRDLARPSRLLPAADSGDHLHPGPEGYRRMGEAVDLGLFFRH